jgi:hypothetical protein
LPAAILGLVAWGCEAGHMFAPVEIGPQITALSAPASVRAGDDLEVAVRALGLIRVDSIVATVRVGDFEETLVARQLGGVRSDFSAAFEFPIPATLTDTLGTVEAYAVDAQDNVGALAAVTIRTIDTDPPAVTVALSAVRIGIGTQLTVTVAATDNIGVSQVGFRILDQAGAELREVLVPDEGTDVTRTFVYTVPATIPLGLAQIVGVAIDHEGLETLSLPVNVVFTDVDLPGVQMLEPTAASEIPAQEPLFARVRISDNDAIDSVRIDGVAHRGSATLGTDTIVTRFGPVMVRFGTPVADTVLQRFLQPAADSSAETAFIRAYAYDRHGNVARDSVQVSLLIDDVAPLVEIRAPLDGGIEGVGDSLLVTTFVREIQAAVRSGVRTLRLEGLAFRGSEELGTFHTVPRFVARTITFDPEVTEVNGREVSRFLTATGGNVSEPVHIIATATDAWGNVRADTVQIRVVHDTIAPLITIQNPAPGTDVVAGSPVTVQLTIVEPDGPDQSGVLFYLLDGVSYRFNPGLAAFDQFPKYQAQRFGDFFPPQPTQVHVPTITLQPTGDVALETVWLRVFTMDHLGNARVDSVNVDLVP